MTVLNTTIKWIDEKPRSWTSSDGNVFAIIQGSFEDDSDWSLMCKPDNEADRRKELQGLLGTAGDYEVEAKKEYQGRAQWKLKKWPGKPEPKAWGGKGGGGGARSWSEAYSQSYEGRLAEQASIHRTVALQQAILFSNQVAIAIPPVDDKERLTLMLAAADEIYDWLRATAPAKPAEKAAEVAAAVPGVTTADKLPGKQNSVLEDYYEALRSYDKVMACVKMYDNVLQCQADGVFEKAETVKLCKEIVAKAIMLSHSKEAWKAVEDLLYKMKQLKTLTNAEYETIRDREYTPAWKVWDTKDQFKEF